MACRGSLLVGLSRMFSLDMCIPNPKIPLIHLDILGSTCRLRAISVATFVASAFPGQVGHLLSGCGVHPSDRPRLDGAGHLRPGGLLAHEQGAQGAVEPEARSRELLGWPSWVKG